MIVRGTAQLFVAGPPVVAAAMGEAPDKEELGGARMQARAGAVDNVAADEEDAFAQLRRFLSYLPTTSGRRRRWWPPPTRRTGARRSCSRSCRATRAGPYKMRRILDAVFDRGSVFELGAPLRPPADHRTRQARRAAGGGARLRPEALRRRRSPRTPRRSSPASSTLCDQFHLPIVNLVDQPGFVIGTEAERAGTIRRGARALFAVYQATRALGLGAGAQGATAWRAPGTATARG